MLWVANHCLEPRDAEWQPAARHVPRYAPPLTWIICPVRYPCSGCARKSAADAISSTCPWRGTGGMLPLMGDVPAEAGLAVSIAPGEITLAVIPLSPNSTASARVSPVRPDLRV